MSRTVTLSQYMPYGAPELLSVARPYMARALVLSALLSPLFFGAVLTLVRLLPGVGAEPREHVVFVLEPPPPAPIQPNVVPQVVPATGGHVQAGVPVPVPDPVADPEQTIATQNALRSGPALPGAGEGEGPLVLVPPADDPLPARDEWKYVEVEPAAVTRVQPDYPEMAREAGVSGRVYVHLLVGRDGRVVKAEVDERRHVLMLDEAALAAARRWVFTPALANGRAVAVWVAVPFDFHLQ
jgi:periplasmic protein TonB